MNDNKPVFKDCSSYAPKIEEGAPNGSPVIKVHAEDEDKGVNGQVSQIIDKSFYINWNFYVPTSEYKLVSISTILGPVFNCTTTNAKGNKI